MIRGQLFDGLSARAQPVELEASEDALIVRLAGETERLIWSRLRRGGPVPDARVIKDVVRPDWSVQLDVAMSAEWASRMVSVDAADRRDLMQMGAASMLTVLAGVGLWFFGGPLLAGLAPLIPQSVLAPMGQAIADDMGPVCDDAAGKAAAAALLARLTPTGAFPEPVSLRIVDRPVVNAVALPGGQVVLFRKLVEEAESADELAGVLAHELAHIEAKHPAKLMVRLFGLSLIVRAFGGGAAGMADEMLLLGSSRAAEAEADAGAVRILQRAGISPAPTAAFFERQAKDGAKRGEIIQTLEGYARSHPADAERAKLFRDAGDEKATSPALNAGMWQSLRGSCAVVKR